MDLGWVGRRRGINVEGRDEEKKTKIVNPQVKLRRAEKPFALLLLSSHLRDHGERNQVGRGPQHPVGLFLFLLLAKSSFDMEKRKSVSFFRFDLERREKRKDPPHPKKKPKEKNFSTLSVLHQFSAQNAAASTGVPPSVTLRKTNSSAVANGANSSWSHASLEKTTRNCEAEPRTAGATKRASSARCQRCPAGPPKTRPKVARRRLRAASKGRPVVCCARRSPRTPPGFGEKERESGGERERER